MIGTLVENTYNPQLFIDFTRALIAASLAAIATSAAALRVPEPIGSTFYCAFLTITATAMCISGSIVDGM